VVQVVPVLPLPVVAQVVVPPPPPQLEAAPPPQLPPGEPVLSCLFGLGDVESQCHCEARQHSSFPD